MNAHAERLVRSIKSESLDQMMFVGRESLVRAITEYATHYHEERSHQGIGNAMVSRADPQGIALFGSASADSIGFFIHPRP